jgi:hypothetical protein
MSGETENEVSGWTTDTLRYLHASQRADDQRYNDAMLKAERELWRALRQEDLRAIAVANTATEAARQALFLEAKGWKDDHNNLIKQLGDQGRQHGEQLIRLVEQLTPRSSLDALQVEHEKDINRLEKFQNRIAGGLLLAAAIGLANLVKIWTS